MTRPCACRPYPGGGWELCDVARRLAGRWERGGSRRVLRAWVRHVRGVRETP